MAYGAFCALVGAVALALAQGTAVPFSKWLDHHINPQKPVLTPSQPVPLGPDLIAARVQVRINKAEGRDYVRQNLFGLETAFDHINSSRGLFVEGAIPRRLPAFILEPRPGREADFNNLVLQGLGSIQLHVFPYRSEENLYKVAAKCGLNSGEGAAWIDIWSTWREDAEKVESSKCVPGGICVVLSRGCEDGAFD